MKSSSPIKLVIFDCDGVLIDSESISASILVKELQAIDVKIDFNYVLQNFLGRSFPEVATEIRDCFGSSLSEDFEKHYRSKLVKEFSRSLLASEGVEDVLNQLMVKSCVATSSSPSRVARSLELVGLDDYFGCNVFTVSEVEKGKPAPDLFLHAAQSMQVDPQNCLVVEDSKYGIQAAQSAGMDVLRYIGGSHYTQSLRSALLSESSAIVFEHWMQFYDLNPQLGKLT